MSVSVTLPKCGLQQIVLHHLTDRWRALGRVAVVCSAWKGAVDGVGAEMWRSALSHWLARHPDACPEFVGDDALAAVKRIAGRLVVPRRVDPASVLLQDRTNLPQLPAGLVWPTTSNERAVTIGGAVTGTLTLGDYSTEPDWNHLGQRAVNLLLDVAGRPNSEVLFRGRCLPLYHFPNAKGVLATIAADVSRQKNGDFEEYTPWPIKQSKLVAYGLTREVLRGVFLDGDFAPDGEDFEDCLRAKMETWAFFAPKHGDGSAAGGNTNARFFPGAESVDIMDVTPIGEGNLLICLELGDGDEVTERPIKSIVVLAERADWD